MTQAPPPVVSRQLSASLRALALGAFQLARPKGTTGHRSLGRTWATPMLAVAIGALWIPRFLQFTSPPRG